MSVLLLFVDGLGIGNRGSHNPLDRHEPLRILNFFENERAAIAAAGIVAETDAQLGVDGLPQSATGQATILTGVNAPQHLGRHLNGYPNRALRELVAKHSMMRTIARAGKRATFANAYHPGFFTRRPRFVSVTTVACEAASLPFRTFEQLVAEEAVSHDFTNWFVKGFGYRVEARTPEKAGTILSRLAARHDFTLYEYFITDIAGHRQDAIVARDIVWMLDRFVHAVLQPQAGAIDLERDTVILTSDHGNIEDITTRAHTLNKVPTIVWGRDSQKIANQIRSLCDITPAILNQIL